MPIELEELKGLGVLLSRKYAGIAMINRRHTAFASRFFSHQDHYVFDGELILAPFNPPIRHISSSRQGALEWGAPDSGKARQPASAGTPGMISAEAMVRLFDGMVNKT